jgi:hypothetical protein
MLDLRPIEDYGNEGESLGVFVDKEQNQWS